MGRIIVATLVGICLFTGCAERAALKSYEREEYNKVISQLKGQVKPRDAAMNYLMAEAYRRSNRIGEAATYYAAAIEAGTDEEMAIIYYAQSLKANQLYDEAGEALRNYRVPTGASSKIRDLIALELDNLAEIGAIGERSNYYRIKNLEDINTKHAEYSPVYAGNSLYFTSNRGGGKTYKTTGTPFTDIYQVQTSGANVEISTLKPLPEIINDPDINEGTLSVSQNGTSIIFGKGNTGKATGNSQVNLYFTRFRTGSWLVPRPLSINDPDSWDSTPALTPDGTTLYFASTRPGGYGGSDLYSAQLSRRGRWIDVQNLGPEVNTPGDEMFPFVSEDGRLYFSSNGHPGFGKLDLFVATRRRGHITVENLGRPMNSASDDFGLYQFDLTRGFFSSNRSGGKGDDDIYTYVNEDPDLKVVNYFVKGKTYTTDDSGQKIILPNTKVTLLSDMGEILGESFTEKDGAFRFRVYAEEHYNLKGEKSDYFATRREFTTKDKSVDKDDLKEFITNVTFETEILMDPIVLEKAIVLNNIYYDLDKAEIRSDAALILDSLVQIMNDNPEISIELGSHTDSRAPDDYNMDLSQRRAKSAVDYIISQGINKKRIVAKGYGETKLIVPSAETEEEHQRNRRTEFKVLQYNHVMPEQEEKPSAPKEGGDEYDRFFDEDESLE